MTEGSFLSVLGRCNRIPLHILVLSFTLSPVLLLYAAFRVELMLEIRCSVRLDKLRCRLNFMVQARFGGIACQEIELLSFRLLDSILGLGLYPRLLQT